jgi:transcriptional regulator with XRE-family HTH domain
VAERRGRGWTQAQLAEQAGVSRATVERLERGARRPSAGMSWRLARALRNTSTMRDQVALDARLRMVAGASLRQFNTRPHRRRARMEAELAKGSGVPVTDADDFGAFTSALLALGF